MGPQGPQGVQGPAGASGPSGPSGTPGTNGTNGTQSFILTGGDLGFSLQAFNFFVLDNPASLLGNNQCGFCQAEFEYDEACCNGDGLCCEELSSPALPTEFKPDQTGVFDPFPGSTPLYYGPGNGVDSIIESEAVPIDQGVASNLWVQTATNPGAGNSYTFRLCRNGDCGDRRAPGLTCTINLPTATECSDTVDTQVFNAGDDITLQGIAISGNSPPDVNATNVKWSVVITQTNPSPTPTLTPTATPSAVSTAAAPKRSRVR
jgi:hypothetical protein